jgi:hypothetical protein
VKAVQPGVQPDSPSRHSRPEVLRRLGELLPDAVAEWSNVPKNIGLLHRDRVTSSSGCKEVSTGCWRPRRCDRGLREAVESRVQDKQEPCLLMVVAGRWCIFPASRLGASATAVSFGQSCGRPWTDWSRRGSTGRPRARASAVSGRG